MLEAAVITSLFLVGSLLVLPAIVDFLKAHGDVLLMAALLLVGLNIWAPHSTEAQAFLTQLNTVPRSLTHAIDWGTNQQHQLVNAYHHSFKG